MTSPFSTFRGTLRQITPATLNDIGKWMVRLCAPHFLPLSDEQARRVLREQQGDLDPTIRDWYVQRQPPRRFSGDPPATRPGKQLDVGRYYSVCEDESGLDSGTLAEELNAYRDPDGGFYTGFFDCMNAQDAASFNLPVSQHIGVVVMHADRFAEAAAAAGAPDRLIALGEIAARQSAPFTVTLGCRISRAEIEGVLDLRQIAAQDWFFDHFVVHCPLQTNATQFVEILPELVHPALGGSTPSNQRLHKVGKWMREHMLNALIYPSARNEVYATYRDGELVRWRGWNMVMYQGAPAPEAVVIDLGGWETEFPRPTVFQRRDLGGPASFEWRIVGQQYRNHAIYDRRAPKPPPAELGR